VVFLDGSPLPMSIIQNKLDKIENQEKESYTKLPYLEEFAKKNGFSMFFQTSAKTGQNVETAFTSFIKSVIEKFDTHMESKTKDSQFVEEETKQKNFILNNTGQLAKKSKEKGCCT
jgi:predicted GTPase